MIKPTFGFVVEYVPDIQAAKRFYIDVLGLDVERAIPHLFSSVTSPSRMTNRCPEAGIPRCTGSSTMLRPPSRSSVNEPTSLCASHRGPTVKSSVSRSLQVGRAICWNWPGNDQAVPCNECGASASDAGSCYLGPRETCTEASRRPQRVPKRK